MSLISLKMLKTIDKPMLNKRFINVIRASNIGKVARLHTTKNVKGGHGVDGLPEVWTIERKVKTGICLVAWNLPWIYGFYAVNDYSNVKWAKEE